MCAPPPRIVWLCRRGVRELDLLLTGFLDTHYATLTARERCALEELLHKQDPELMDWLWGRESAPTDELGRLIERIRRHAESGT